MSRFIPGVSGNPGGRPSGLSRVTELARAHSEKALDALVAALDDTDPMVRMKAADMLLTRAWGKPAQALDEMEQRATEVRVQAMERAHSRTVQHDKEMALMFPSRNAVSK